MNLKRLTLTLGLSALFSRLHQSSRSLGPCPAPDRAGAPQRHHRQRGDHAIGDVEYSGQPVHHRRQPDRPEWVHLDH